MSIIQATRHPVNLSRFSGDVITSIPSGWDTNYVKQVCRVGGNAGGVGWRHILPTALSDHWYQVEMRIGNMGTGSATTTSRIAFYDSSGTLLFRFGGTSAPTFQYWTGSGTTFTTICTTPTLTAATVYTLSFRFNIADSGGEITLYINGTQIGSSFTGDTKLSSATAISYVDFANVSVGSGAGSDDHWSGFVSTTGDENPYGIKIKTHVPTGAGATSGWTGTFANIDDNTPDTTDVITAATAGLTSTFVMDDPPSLTGSDVIRGVYMSAMARCGTTGPQNMNLVLRASSTDQLSSTKALTTGWRTFNHFFEDNSVTSAEFTPTEIAAAELGVKSVT